jgi:uncharacterized protein YutE (UPF0331/DUF86 family)
MEAATSRERQRARAIAEEYRSRGYEVIEQPAPGQLPEFLASYRPDLLVRRGDEATIVVVKSRSSLAKEPQITELARLLPAKPHWNFELVVVGEGEQLSTPEGARPFTRDDVLQGIEEAERLVASGFSEAALLSAWSISEATVRLLTEEEGIVLDGYSPLYILKQAAINGVISRDEYNFLTMVMKYRNALVHGFKTTDFDPAFVTELIKLTRHLLQSTSETPST